MKIRNIISNILLALNYYRKYAPLYFYGQLIFTVFVSFIATIQGPITIKFLMDAIINDKPIEEIITFLIIVTLLVIVRHVFACYIVEYLDVIANIKVQEKILKEFYEKAVKMDLEYYETPSFYTDYIWAAQQATTQFKGIYNSFNVFISRLSETVFVGGVLVVINPMLMFFAIAMSLIALIGHRKQIKITYEANVEAKPIERKRDYSKRVFYLKDYAKELRLSQMHEVIYSNFCDANKKLCHIWKKSGEKSFCVMTIVNILIEIFGTLGMYGYLAYEVMVTGCLTFGDFSALAQSAKRFASRIGQVLDVMLAFVEKSIYMDKLRKFMEYEPKIEKQKGLFPEKELKPIVIKNVSFAYNGAKKPCLKNVNMIINPYEKVAIVGYNGAGKTTLIKLLMRLYDPTEGDIYIGDRNIKEFDVEEYRKEFAVVFQDYQIFAATLGENVAMDMVEQNDKDRILEALFNSGFDNMHKDLAFSIETPLTKEFRTEGVNLSGGEMQKIAIARAFYKKSHYAVMDEPSSALDPIAEYKFNQNMMDIAKERTVIFISHRLSTTVMADKIYMFDNGVIIEQGNHKELMALNGKYAEMFKKQSINYML